MIELLLALIIALTGIARDVDPGLTAIAERRAAETTTDATFNHDNADPCCAEVLAANWNSDPATGAAEQWRGSPGHWAILTDTSLTRIGCGHAVGLDGRHNFACVLARSTTPPSPPPPPAPPSPSTPPLVLLPNTAASP